MIRLSKKSLSLCLVLLLCVSFLIGILPANAESALLHDEAGLLSDSGRKKIEDALNSLRERFHFDAVILTTNEYIGSSDEETQAFADQCYASSGYREDGYLFVISMYDRWYVCRGYGMGETAVDDSTYYDFLQEMLPYLSNGYYDYAFLMYADFLNECLTYYENSGVPMQSSKYDGMDGFEYDVEDPLAKPPFLKRPSSYIICIVLGSLLALIPTLTMKKKLKSVAYKSTASGYMVPNSLQMSNQQDLFLYANVSKVARVTDSNSSGRSGGSSFGGHSGGHISSGSFSHGGSSGRF